MSYAPQSKRRKLTPPPTDGEESSNSIPEITSSKSAFYRTASSWNLEQDYEAKPRRGKKREKESTRLPIKTAEGVVQQVVAQDDNNDAAEASSDLEWAEGSGSEDDAIEEESTDTRPPSIPVQQQIIEAKEEIARLASLLNEDPEEHASAFKSLAQLGHNSNSTIKKLALAAQMKIYKDVIPGYRIRPLSDQDMETKVSKEVKRIRAYEQLLVGGYQAYIKELAKFAQSGRSSGPSGNGPSLSTIAISCACNLLTSVPHFNFRGELLKILVGKLSTRKIDEEFRKCLDTIEALFRIDDDGTPSLDAVSLLTKMMKARGYRVDESVLNTFLHLRLLSEFSHKASQNRVDSDTDAAQPQRKKKEKREFRTKKQRKLMKEHKEIEKEMSQADAIVSHEERDRMQAESLKLVFVTYFRILKFRSSNLMGAVLEGLAKYAHLINQDFFGDLLEALKDLISHAESVVVPEVAEEEVAEDQTEDDDDNTKRNLTRESLLCINTAFALLDGQSGTKTAATLSLDLSFFTGHLYGTLPSLALNPEIERSSKSLHLPDPNAPPSTNPPVLANKVNIATTIVLLLRALSAVLLPTHMLRAVPPLRIAAFTHHLMAMSLHLPEKSSIAMLSLLEKLTKVHGKKMGALWDTEERRGDGRFDFLGGDVEGTNPFAGTVWQGELLRMHYCPAIRESVKVVERNVVAGR